jgi:hypothetical protein
MMTMYVLLAYTFCTLSNYVSERVTKILQMTKTKTTALMGTRNMVAVPAVAVRREYLRKKKRLPSPKVGPIIHLFRILSQTYIYILVTSRPPSSDTDSEYGARSKKKKKPRVSGDELRTSSRGVKVPNYADDAEDFEQFDDLHPGYYIDPNTQEKENDEIEAVLGHARDEGHEDDPEDLWYENLVSSDPISFWKYVKRFVFPAFPYQVEGILPFAEH